MLLQGSSYLSVLITSDDWYMLSSCYLQLLKIQIQEANTDQMCKTARFLILSCHCGDGDFTSCHLKVPELCEKKIGKLALTDVHKQPNFC